MTRTVNNSTPDLSTLQYPRHIHRAGGVSQIVADAWVCQRALADGWFLLPPPVAAPSTVNNPALAAEAPPAGRREAYRMSAQGRAVLEALATTPTGRLPVPESWDRCDSWARR
jgi:hypothetical protein